MTNTDSYSLAARLRDIAVDVAELEANEALDQMEAPGSVADLRERARVAEAESSILRQDLSQLEEKLAAKAEELRLVVERLREKDAIHAMAVADLERKNRGYDADRFQERLRADRLQGALIEICSAVLEDDEDYKQLASSPNAWGEAHIRLRVDMVVEAFSRLTLQVKHARGGEQGVRTMVQALQERLATAQRAAHDRRDELQRTASILGLPDPLPSALEDDFFGPLSEDFLSARANLASELTVVRNRAAEGRVEISKERADYWRRVEVACRELSRLLPPGSYSEEGAVMEATDQLKQLQGRVADLEAKQRASTTEKDPIDEILGMAQRLIQDLGKK